MSSPGQVAAASGRRAHTPLYGIRPQGVGSAGVESTYSYVLGLAHEHGLSANVFMRELLQAASQSMSRRAIATWRKTCRKAGCPTDGSSGEWPR